MDRIKQAENVEDIDWSPVSDRAIFFAGLKSFDNGASIRLTILLRVSEINLVFYLIITIAFEIRCMFYFLSIFGLSCTSFLHYLAASLDNIR